MKYGLPYKGSKNKLAERIVRLLPRADHLIDLFCGGCAVTHAALVMGKYPHCHINDVNWMCPQLFTDALAGRYNDETRWISREDFERLKDSDPYVAFVWSFGNNLRTYLYSKEIEPFKRALHYAIFFDDYEPAKEFDLDLSFLANLPKDAYHRRYLSVKRYFDTMLQITPPTNRLESAERHFAATAISRSLKPSQTNVQQNCNTSNVTIECCNSKKKNLPSQTCGDGALRAQKTDFGGCNTESVTTDCQVFGGVAKFTSHKLRA